MGRGTGGHHMQLHEEGQWVKFDDIEHLLPPTPETKGEKS